MRWATRVRSSIASRAILSARAYAALLGGLERPFSDASMKRLASWAASEEFWANFIPSILTRIGR